MQSQARLHHLRVKGKDRRANGNKKPLQNSTDNKLWINILWKGKGSGDIQVCQNELNDFSLQKNYLATADAFRVLA